MVFYGMMEKRSVLLQEGSLNVVVEEKYDDPREKCGYSHREESSIL